MGFSSIDDMVTEITTNSKFLTSYFQKTSSNGATSAAGRWHEFFTATGIPTAGSFTGTAGVATQMNRSTTGALDIGADVSTNTRHLLTATALTASTTMVPAVAVLLDLLLYYPSNVVTGSPTTLNNTATLPRYTTGAGVQCFICVQTALGAASPTLTLTYTDDSGNTGNTALVMTSPVNSAPISTLFLYNGGPFLPLNAGDTGIRKIDSYTLGSGTTGTVAFVLAKPLATIPLLAANTASERDFLYQIPSLPQVLDGACLGWVVLIGGAMTTLQTLTGKLDMGWG